MEPNVIADLLLSDDNPEGHTLEKLLKDMIRCVELKNMRQRSPDTMDVLGHLYQAWAAQERRMEKAMR